MYAIGLLLLSLHTCWSAQVVVNCTWPCAEAGHICIVSNASIQCGPQYNSQWTLPTAVDSPVFVGEVARRHMPCVTSPNPSFAETNGSLTDPAHQSTITWPPDNDLTRPLDEYLSDCEPDTYCSRETRICVDCLAVGDTCQSTNQCCQSAVCRDNQCVPDTTSMIDPNMTSPPKQHTNKAGYIAGGVIGGVGVLLLLLGVFMYWRRRAARTGNMPGEASIMGTPPQQSTLLPPTPSPSEPQTTPSMQQQHLQFQLQHHRWQEGDDVKDAVRPNQLPPPPYSP